MANRGWLFVGWIMTLLALGQAAFTQTEQSTNATLLKEIREGLRGRAREPAEKIFKNIEILEGREAGRLPGMMGGLVDLLGVECQHCHVVGEWHLETKPPKVTARAHFQMQKRLNDEQFGGENKITCWTCHRGSPKPEIQPSAKKE